MRKQKIFSLIKQELRIASRSRYLVISFILLPIIMWAFQGGIQLFVVNLTTEEVEAPYEGETFYIINKDIGNSTHNMGQMLVQDLLLQVDNESLPLYKTVVDYSLDNMTFDEVSDLIREGNTNPVVFILANYTSAINQYTSTFIPGMIFILHHPNDGMFASDIQRALYNIYSYPPYTQLNVEHRSATEFSTVVYEGEEGASNEFSTGFISYLIIILTVMAPAPYVSAAFAGEREKGTLESLLVLPIRRVDVLISKVLAGIIIICLFAVSNIVGLLLFGLMMNTAEEIDGADFLAIDVNLQLISAVVLMVMLTAFVALGIGISLASIAKDTQSAEGTYVAVMLLPAIIVGMTAMLGSFPEGLTWMYIIPWMHSIAILNKGMYPETYSTYAITGSIMGDMFLHFGYLFLFVAASLFIASKLFGRESLIK
ncbi:MAG: ABC transporter permease subunit [Candidatus Heimdallarchaeota archaeon]|nr:ABC transporter permease subunit [Candidatus Heimdallarchaeota archaeon]